MEHLDWLLAKIEPSSFMEIASLPSNLIISLIQQIGSHLEVNTEIKLIWLAEIFTLLDPNAFKDPNVSELVSSVLEGLFANLRIIFAETPVTSPAHKQVKTVMRLVRLSM